MNTTEYHLLRSLVRCLYFSIGLVSLVTTLSGCNTSSQLAGSNSGISEIVPRTPYLFHSANVIEDPSFESNNAEYWKQCGTIGATFTKAQAHSGEYSEVGGTISWPLINGTAAVCQTVTVPKHGSLEFWVRQDTDGELPHAWQESQILDAKGANLKTLYRVAGQTNGWELRGPYDLNAYAGQEVVLKFAVHGDTFVDNFVNQYVDDVSLTDGALRPPPSPKPSPIPGTTPIKHIIIVLQENRSFDNVFHGYPGANYAQFGVDHQGNKVALHKTHLMTSWDPGHGYENWVTEYNYGAMNGFDLESLDHGSAPFTDFAYSYAMQSDVQPYWDLAKEGVLGDNMFADHRSQTFAGHLYVVAGAAGPIAPNMPDWYVANNPDSNGGCAEPGQGEAIDILTGLTNQNYTTSCFDFRTIADLLDAKHVSWRYYVDSADKYDVVSGFAAIKHAYGGSDWENVVTPATTIFQDIQDGTLPAVSWVVGTVEDSDHAGQTVPSSNGPTWVSSVFNAVGKSKYWKESAIILTWDDWGGWYDHVKPVTWNYYEPGFRLPLVIDSPYARRGYVSHNAHYTGSILHLIENTYGLGSLHVTDAKSDAFDDVFNFSQAPLPYIPVKAAGDFQQFFDTNNSGHEHHPAERWDRD